MRDDGFMEAHAPYRVVILTLDSHSAGPCERIAPRLAADFPGLELHVLAAAEWGEDPAALDHARDVIARGDIVITSLLFLEDHIEAILPALAARRDECDAMVGIIADAKIVRTTRMGSLDMARPESGTLRFLKMLRGTSKPSVESGARKMRMLRRLPRLLKLVPGKAQDLRAWFLSMQYWLGASDENVEALVRFLISRYSSRPDWQGAAATAPVAYPDAGLYHPDLPGRITTDPDALPSPEGARGTVGLLMMRSYVLSADTAHYDAVTSDSELNGT